MPRKTKPTALADQAAQPQFSAELLEQLIPGPMTPGRVRGLFDQFKKSILERALGAEMSHHLGYAPGQAKPAGGCRQSPQRQERQDRADRRRRLAH